MAEPLLVICPPLPVLDDYANLLDQWAKPVWVEDSKEFFNESELEFPLDKAGKTKYAKVVCYPGDKYKAAVTRFGERDFSSLHRSN